MDKSTKFVLPSPVFVKNAPTKSQPHYLTPSGMTLLTSKQQPPPMFGPKGSTVPPKFLKQNAEIKQPEEPPKPKPYCEACDMELQSSEDFRRHRAQHERCPVDGCKFKGHPNVMDKHVTALHSSGLFDKIKKISTPEEIAAWREERRKKYPTLANAKMQQLAKEQRERRGERLTENKARFGRHEDRKRARVNVAKTDNERNEQPKRMRNHENSKQWKVKDKFKKNKDAVNLKKPAEAQLKVEKVEEQKNYKVVDDEIVVCGIKMFRGTSQLRDYKHEKTKAEKAKHALVSLVGMYGSDDDDEDEDEDSTSESTTSQCVEENAKILLESHEFLNSGIDLENECINEQILKADPGVETNEAKNVEVKELNSVSALNDNAELNLSEQELVANAEIVQDCIIEKQDKLETMTDAFCEEFSKEAAQHQFTTKNQEIMEVETLTVEETHKSPVCNFNEHSTVALCEENAANTDLNESSDEAPEEAPIQRTTTMPEVQPTTSSEAASSNQTESIEAKHLRIEETRKKLKAQQTHALNIRKRRIRKQNTMLEKLLEPEIRHERNVLLQCVRFVCENNFFGIGETVSKPQP